MTILAGVIRLSSDACQTPTSILDAMLVGLHPGFDGQTTRVKGNSFDVAHVDTGALAVPGHLKDDEGRFSAVAGWPIVRTDATCPADLAGDLAYLHREITQGNVGGALANCCGQFVLLYADSQSDRFVIACDKGGFRPLYWAVHQGQFVFATMLKLLEAIPGLTQQVDMRGLVEHAVLGYPLADRTPYATVKLLAPGSFIEIRSGDLASASYFSRADVRPFQGNRDDALDELFRHFLAAVRDRAAPFGTQRSFLSGGLDARSVVMALRVNGHSVQTVTFDKPGYPDGFVASMIAKNMASNHSLLKVRHGCSQRDLKASVFRLFPGLDDGRSRAIFTGDGGSVGIGLDYVTNQMLDCFTRNDVPAGVDDYLTNRQLARRIFWPHIYESLRGLVREGVLEELSQNRHRPPLLRYYLFLLRNDQRRHLHYYFEQIDAHRIEFLTPFYDSRVLDFIASCPLQWFLFHEGYHEWIKRFPAEMTNVPWQTYPGHVPCPIPLDAGNQWKLPFRSRVAQGVPMARSVLRYISMGRFPRHLLRRGPTTLAAILQILRLSHKPAILRTAQVFCRYAGSSDNAHSSVAELPSAS